MFVGQKTTNCLSKLIFIDTINIFLSFILLFLTKNIMFIYNVPIIIL
jgi:hypothetical protein